MSQPETCYLCDEIVTFCQCERSVTDKDEALAILRDRLAEPRQAEATGGELGKALRSLLAYPGLESYVGSVLYGRATNALQSIRWGIDHLLSVGQGNEKRPNPVGDQCALNRAIEEALRRRVGELESKLDQCLHVVREYVSSELADDPSQDDPSCQLYPLIELVRKRPEER